MFRMTTRSSLKALALLSVAGLTATSASGLGISTSATEPTTDLLFAPAAAANVGSGQQATFATRFAGGLDETPGTRARGQSFSFDTDANPASAPATHEVATLTMMIRVDSVIPAGADLLLEIFEWTNNDPEDLSGWALGDGRTDGDTLDGTGMTAFYSQNVALPEATYAADTFLNFDFDPGAVMLDEDKAYGFSIQYTLPPQPTGSTEQLNFAVTVDPTVMYDGLLLQTTDIENRNSGSRDMIFYLQAPSTGDPADLDGDGDVDDADFGIAFAAFTGPNNGPSSNPAADLDGDGDVDDADFGIAFAAFTGPNPSTVPEPTSLALLGLGGLLIARRRRA